MEILLIDDITKGAGSFLLHIFKPPSKALYLYSKLTSGDQEY
jgi:hypothetical protein